jgi:hypothetical protein
VENDPISSDELIGLSWVFYILNTVLIVKILGPPLVSWCRSNIVTIGVDDRFASSPDFPGPVQSGGGYRARV